MHASIDSQIMEVEGLTEVRNKLRKQITETIENNNEGTNLLFRPFLLGAPLHDMYQCLINAQNEVTVNRRNVIAHLIDIITIQNELSAYLTDLHGQLVKVIVDSEFMLIQLIINNLLSSHEPIPDIWLDCTAVEEVFNALLTQDNIQDVNVIALSESIKTLLKKLNEDSLSQRFDEIMTSWEKQSFATVESYDSLQEITQIFVKHLETLLNEANQLSFENLIQKINAFLDKIKLVGCQYIKQDIDKQIQLINADPWAIITDKKKLYCDLIPKIKQLCQQAPDIDTTDLELYCKQLFAGFELTREASFLDLIADFGKIFYSNNAIILQHISDYIQSAKDTVVTTNDSVTSILKKRVHFSNENQVKYIEARGTPPQYDNEPTPKKLCTVTNNANRRELADKFINILDPVISEAGLSRKFAVVVLIHIAESIHSLTTETGPYKLFMELDILTNALDICPVEATELQQELKEKIETLSNRIAIKGYQKDAHPHNSVNSKQTPLTVIARFKTILSSLVQEIDSATPSSISFNIQMQSFIDYLFIQMKDDPRHRINQKNLQTIQMPFMTTSTAPVLISVNAPVQKSVTHHSKRNTIPTAKPQITKYRSLADAMLCADLDDFKIHLKTKKQSMQPKEYLEFLTQKNDLGFTPLHTVLHLDNFKNYGVVPIYFSEVKSMFAELGYSYPDFLVTKTTTRLTFLHLIARSGDLDFLKSAICYFKRELSKSEYARALRIESNFGHFPKCPPEKKGAEDINEYLRYERYHNSLNNIDNFFSNNDAGKASHNNTGSSIQPGSK